MKCKVCATPVNDIKVAKTPVSGYRSKSIEESLAEPRFNLIFRYCPNCNMVKYELEEGAAKVLDRLYYEHVSTYYFTQAMTDYMNDFIDGLASKYNIGKESTVLEIGCNSGRMLTMFRDKTGCEILGVEPSKTFDEEWEEENVEVINEYFTEDIAKQLQGREFDLIIIRHVYEHIPDPVKFFEDLSSICNDTTTVVIEVPYFVTVLDRKRIENISYSHLNYFTIRSMSEIAAKFGMGVKEFNLVETDGGAIVYHISKGTVTSDAIKDNISQEKIQEFVDYIQDAKAKVKEVIKNYNTNEVVGYGAGSKGMHLIYILELDENINIVVDETPGTDGMFVPGTAVRITHPDIFKNGKIKAVLNLAPTHSETIRSKVPAHVEFIEVI